MPKVDPIRKKSDIEKMKKYLGEKDRKFRLLFVLGINSGLRISDLVDLKVKDVMVNGKPKSVIKVREKKTKKLKEFVPNKSVKYELRFYKDADPESYLFPSQKKKKGHICPEYAYRVIKQAAEELGIEGNIGSHTMRKTFGYQQLKHGTDIELIMEMLNHSSMKNTLKYLGITQEQIFDAYRRVSL